MEQLFGHSINIILISSLILICFYKQFITFLFFSIFNYILLKITYKILSLPRFPISFEKDICEIREVNYT